MMRTYDDWKIGYDEEGYPGPSKREVGERIADLEREIAWLKNILENILLNEEDRAQTIDYMTELEEELHYLLWSFQWPISGGIRRGADAL